MIAFYVHHHGRGHLHRASSIARRIGPDVVGLSSAPMPEGWPGRWVQLPDDALDVEDVDPSRELNETANGALHWVPTGHPGLRRRMAMISRELDSGPVEAIVVDVSVEVALLARLHGIRVAVMAQPGDRLDPAHRIAYDTADRLLAPWPSRDQPGWPASWIAKTVHLGAISRFDGRVWDGPRQRSGVVALWGAGGVDVSSADLRAAAVATPQWRWDVIGPRPPVEEVVVPNLTWHGWVPDPWSMLCGAAVIVTHAGQNAVAEVAAARTPAVVMPQHRPFGEQHATADELDRTGLATVVSPWPSAERWPGILEQARSQDGRRWQGWSDGAGAERASAVLRDWVGR